MTDFKYIFWDFDGVIINSDSVRVEGFRKVLNNFPQSLVEQLLEFHALNGGLSRYVKFRYFYEEILDKKITDSEVNDMAVEFSVIMREKLTDKKVLIPETIKFIEENSRNGKVQFIVSGSDQEELRYLCGELGIKKYFQEIKGSPTPKNKLVEDLMATYQIKASQAVLIGDAINDYEAAMVNGISFRGYNNLKLKKLGNYIESFSKWS